MSRCMVEQSRGFPLQRTRWRLLAVLLLVVLAPLTVPPGADAAEAPVVGDVLEAESFVAADSYCDPDHDNEHTEIRKNAGSSGGLHVFLPRSGCGLSFGTLDFDTYRTFTRFRVQVGGSDDLYEGIVRVLVDDEVVAQGTYKAQATDGLQTYAFDLPLTVAPGEHTVRVDYRVRDGPYYGNLFIDFLRSTVPERTAGGGEGLPDLTIVETHVVDGKARASHLGDGHHSFLRIRNEGTGDAPASVIKMHGERDDVTRWGHVPSIPHGMDLNVSLPWHQGLYGDQRLTYTVDPNGTIAESDENDNTWSRPVQLPGAEVSIDLKVPEGPWVRDAPIRVEAYISNHGPAVLYGADFSGLDERYGSWHSVGPVEAGSATTTSIGVWSPDVDKETLRVTIDPNDRLAQTDRSDDTDSATAALLDPTPMNISLDVLQIGSSDGESGPDRYFFDLYLRLVGDHVAPQSTVVLKDAGQEVRRWDLPASWSAGDTIPDGPAFQWYEWGDGYTQTVSLQDRIHIADGHLPRFTVELVTDPGRTWEKKTIFDEPAPAFARPGVAFRYWEMADVLEGESYSLPDAACAPEADGEHIRFDSDASATYMVLPRSGCGAGFGSARFTDHYNASIYFTAERTIDSVRLRVDGAEQDHAGTFRVFIDHEEAARGNYTLAPKDGFVDIPLASDVIPSGRHVVRVAFETRSGPAASDLHVDRLDSSVVPGSTPRPPPPDDTYEPPPPPPPQPSTTYTAHPVPTYTPYPRPTQSTGPDPRLDVGPSGLRQLDGTTRVGQNATFAVEVSNPHDETVRLLVRWAFEDPFGGPSTVAEDVIQVPPGRTNVTRTVWFQDEHVGAQSLLTSLLVPGTPPTENYPPDVWHGEARIPLDVRPPVDHLVISPETEARPSGLGTTEFHVLVQANQVDAPFARLEIVDDGGHLVRVDGFPADIPAGGSRTFVVIVESPDRVNATGEVIVRAVSATATSDAIILRPEVEAQTDLPAQDPERFGTTAMVVAAAGTGLAGLVAAIMVWANEVRRYDLLRRLLQGGLGVALFSRIQGAKVLDHDTRDEINRLVTERPGVHYREILRTLGLSNGRLAHHLQTLEREGLIRGEKDGRLMRFYPAKSPTRVGTLLSPRQTTILTHIKRTPGILQSELAKTIGVSRQALHQQVAGLRDAGLLVASASGRTNALYLESDLDVRIRKCAGCGTRYDRGVGSLDAVVCPGCGAA